MTYRIKTISEMTGIPRATILAWERRYGVIAPKRADNGYRMYCDADLAQLRRLQVYLKTGLKISEAVARMKDDETAGDKRLATTPIDGGPPELLAELELALLKFDRDAALQALAQTVSWAYPRMIHAVYLPVLRNIGQGWHDGVVSINQEHFASAFVREQMIAILVRIGSGPPDGLHVACTTFPEEAHEFGILAMAIELALRGRRVTYLGANLPATELSSFARTAKPSWLCVSVITQRTADELIVFARRVHDNVPPGTSLLIGGAGLPVDGLPEIDGVVFVRQWEDHRGLPL